jgi:hypothetical protein
MTPQVGCWKLALRSGTWYYVDSSTGEVEFHGEERFFLLFGGSSIIWHKRMGIWEKDKSYVNFDSPRCMNPEISE